MRKVFLEGATPEQAEQLAPWAAEIVEADGGCWAFESVDEAAEWHKQL